MQVGSTTCSSNAALVVPVLAPLLWREFFNFFCTGNTHSEAGPSAHPSTCGEGKGPAFSETLGYHPFPYPILFHTVHSHVLSSWASPSPKPLLILQERKSASSTGSTLQASAGSFSALRPLSFQNQKSLAFCVLPTIFSFVVGLYIYILLLL